MLNYIFCKSALVLVITIHRKSNQKESTFKNYFVCSPQVLVVSLMICLSLGAAPGWSIWTGGMWNIPDDDGDNIPGKIDSHVLQPY